MHRQDSNFLRIDIITADFTMTAVRNEPIRAVPILDDIQSFLNLTSDRFVCKIVAYYVELKVKQILLLTRQK